MFGTDDMTFCTADCAMKDECYRNPTLIKEPQYPHSYADFSTNCMAYTPKESDGKKRHRNIKTVVNKIL